MERQIKLLVTICAVVLLWAGLWQMLARLHGLFGLPTDNLAVALTSVILTVVILATAWCLSWRDRQLSRSSMVCVRCNLVKFADGQLSCKCGGQYLTLAEMKWVNPSPAKRAAK